MNPVANKLLGLVAKADSPVCVFDIPHKGGATYYSMRRMQEYLTLGRGVVRLTCGPDGSLTGTAHYRDLNASFTLPGLHVLGAAPMPRFHTLLVNNLAGWTLPDAASFKGRPNGSGRPRWIPQVIKEILALALKSRARIEYIVHDYLPVCPNFILVHGEHSRYCGVPSLDSCAVCLAGPAMRSALGDDFSLASWRRVWDAFLSRADRIVVPSAASRDILLRAFGEEEKRLAVVPHEPLVPMGLHVPLPGKNTPMHVVVVGKITIPKGAAIVRDLGRLFGEQARGERITVVGEIAAPGIEMPDTVAVTGEYEKEHLGQIVRDIGATVALMPSIWPETFNYVCQELMGLGLPLVCFDLGAPAERVRAWERGLVVEDIGAAPALEALRALDGRRTA